MPPIPTALMAVLSKYVVLTRMQPGCRNIDLCASVTQPGRYLDHQKWDDGTAQRAHFDSDVMVEMATACNGLLTRPPTSTCGTAPSAHDLPELDPGCARHQDVQLDGGHRTLPSNLYHRHARRRIRLG